MKITPRLVYFVVAFTSFIVTTKAIWHFFPYQSVDLMPPVGIEWTEEEVSQPPT